MNDDAEPVLTIHADTRMEPHLQAVHMQSAVGPSRHAIASKIISRGQIEAALSGAARADLRTVNATAFSKLERLPGNNDLPATHAALDEFRGCHS